MPLNINIFDKCLINKLNFYQKNYTQKYIVIVEILKFDTADKKCIMHLAKYYNEFVDTNYNHEKKSCPSQTLL